jgi:ElaB/YqjD/DUF883 family membrane-anchored ribosome-binding protein
MLTVIRGLANALIRAKQGIETMVGRIGTYEISTLRPASVAHPDHAAFEAAIGSARSSHSGAGTGEPSNVVLTAAFNGEPGKASKPDEGGKPQDSKGIEELRKIIDALEKAMRGDHRPAEKLYRELLKRLSGEAQSEFSSLAKEISHTATTVEHAVAGFAKTTGNFVTNDAEKIGVPVAVTAAAGGLAAVTVDAAGVGAAVAALF